LLSQILDAYDKISNATNDTEIEIIINNLLHVYNNEIYAQIVASLEDDLRFFRRSEFNDINLSSYVICKNAPTLDFISSSGEQVNIFSPFESVPNALDTETNIFNLLKASGIPIKTYAVRARGTYEEFNKCLIGPWAQCEVRYETFDAVIMSYEDAFVQMSTSLSRGLKYVKPNGTAIIYGLVGDFIPHQLQKIAESMHDIRVIMHAKDNNLMPIRECSVNPYYLSAIIIGKKGPSNDFHANYKTLLDAFMKNQSITLPFEFIGCSEDPSPFRTYNITLTEYEELQNEILNVSKDITSLILPKKEKDSRRPLLPFTSGQLGLVLISGDIDGIIEEPNGCRHAVKGYSSRGSSDTTEDILNADGELIGSKRIRTSFSTTEVNVITPDGNIRSLRESR
jgi:hypothetical protein